MERTAERLAPSGASRRWGRGAAAMEGLTAGCHMVPLKETPQDASRSANAQDPQWCPTLASLSPLPCLVQEENKSF